MGSAWDFFHTCKLTRELITVSWILPGDVKLLGERQRTFITHGSNNCHGISVFGTSSRKPSLSRMTCRRPSALYSQWLLSQERILEFLVPESFRVDGKPGCS